MIKKKLYLGSILLFFIVIAVAFTGCSQSKRNSNSKVTIRLNEVARSTFYAPMYVAINQGFFKEQGIDIELTTGQGADATTTKAQEGTTLVVTPSYNTLRGRFITY